MQLLGQPAAACSPTLQLLATNRRTLTFLLTAQCSRDSVAVQLTVYQAGRRLCIVLEFCVLFANPKH